MGEDGIDDRSPTPRDRSRRRAARNTAGPLLHEAASRLLSGVTLDDLTAFITVGRLARESGLSNGAIYSAHRPSVGSDGRERSAPQSAAREAFMSVLARPNGLALEVIDLIERFVEAGASDRDIVDGLSQVIGDDVEASARGESGWDYTHVWLCAAVSLNDAEVRASVAAAYEDISRLYAELVPVILELTERVTVEGVTVDELARMLIDVGDAAAFHVRIDADAPPGIAARLISSTYFAMTRRRGDHADDTMRQFAGPVTPPGAEQRDRITAAVRRIVEQNGWDAVTLTGVRYAAEVDRSVLLSVAPTRHHLAAVVWADVVDSIERRARRCATLPVEDQVDQLVGDVAGQACHRRSAVASLLQARLYDVSIEVTRSVPPIAVDATDRLAMLLADLLAQMRVGEGAVRAPDGSLLAARTGIDALLLAAATTDHPADRLASVLLAGLAPHERRASG